MRSERQKCTMYLHTHFRRGSKLCYMEEHKQRHRYVVCCSGTEEGVPASTARACHSFWLTVAIAALFEYCVLVSGDNDYVKRVSSFFLVFHYMRAIICFSESSGFSKEDKEDASLFLFGSPYACYTQQLKISSSETSWHRVVGYGGNIDIQDTLVRKFDTGHDIYNPALVNTALAVSFSTLAFTGKTSCCRSWNI